MKKIKLFWHRVKHYYRIEVAREDEWPESKPFADLKDWFLCKFDKGDK
jgi:hypothetical protein